MFNLPVKLSVLSEQYDALSPQVFLDKTPEECINLYRNILRDKQRQTLDFSFTVAAMLLVLEKEFEVRVVKRELIFIKNHLDAESWLYANGLKEYAPDEQLLGSLENIADTLWTQTAMLSPIHTTLDDRLALKREIKVLLYLHAIKYGQYDPQFIEHLATPSGLKRFLNLVVAEAIYKADGAKILFGRESHYYQLWLEKQAQFYTYACHALDYLLKRSA